MVEGGGVLEESARIGVPVNGTIVYHSMVIKYIEQAQPLKSARVRGIFIPT